MCHDHLTRHRAWNDGAERETVDERETDGEREESFDGDDAPIPPLQADDDDPDDDVDDDVELLTDGGDA